MFILLCKSIKATSEVPRPQRYQISCFLFSYQGRLAMAASVMTGAIRASCSSLSCLPETEPVLPHAGHSILTRRRSVEVHRVKTCAVLPQNYHNIDPGRCLECSTSLIRMEAHPSLSPSSPELSIWKNVFPSRIDPLSQT